MDGLEVVLMVYISDSFVENTTVRSIQLVQIQIYDHFNIFDMIEIK
jgi:hypothetical protein